MTHLPIQDTDRTVTLQEQETVYSGAIWDISRDTFTMNDGEQPLTREYIQHPGAVAIVAVDDQQRVAMIRQYRHPVGQDCWEIPAGLLDGDGESLLATAQRELAEETDLTAQDWSILVDHYPSAGSSAEAIRIYLAQGIQLVPEEQRYQRDDEEAHLTLQWVPLDDAIDAVMSGAIKNVNAVAGILATQLVFTTSRQPRSIDSAS